MKGYFMEEQDWVRLIGGGFAHMTAPFALHKAGC